MSVSLVIISANGRHTDLLLPGGRSITKVSDDVVLLLEYNERQVLLFVAARVLAGEHPVQTNNQSLGAMRVVTQVAITLCAAATSGESGGPRTTRTE